MKKLLIIILLFFCIIGYAYGTSLTAGSSATERTLSNNTAANASQAHENMPPYLAVYM